MGPVKLYYNCRILRNHVLTKDDLWVQDGRFIDPDTVEHRCDYSIDCYGSIVAPGFIDLKMNGAFGIDFARNESVEEGLAFVAKRLPATGVTSFCPCLVTSSKDTYHRILPRLKRSEGSGQTGAAVLGVHLDGPFITPAKKGAHIEKYIKTFERGTETVRETYGELDNVLIVTLAPELEHAEDVVRNLTRWGIKVSVGHSNASLTQAENVVNAGASLVSHVFNAMASFHHRDPGVVGLMTSGDIGRPVYFGLIADGNHTHPTTIRAAWSCSQEHLFLVSDAIAPMGLGRGEFTLGDLTVTVDGEPLAAHVKGDALTLSGSVAPFDFCLRHFWKVTECPLVDALEAASLHPALAVGLGGKKGTLDPGADADFVLLSENTLTVLRTYIHGELAFGTEEEIEEALSDALDYE